MAEMTRAGRVLTGKAINLLNSEFFRDLGLTGREAHLLIGLLMKVRRSWDDIGNPEGWEPFKAGLDSRRRADYRSKWKSVMGSTRRVIVILGPAGRSAPP